MNAVYFKGNWLHKFNAAITRPEPFYLGSKENSVDANMMRIETKLRSGYLDNLDARVLELPYVVFILFNSFNYFQIPKKNVNISETYECRAVN